MKELKEEDYVSFKVAKLFKEKGFNERTLYHYTNCDVLQHNIVYNQYKNTEMLNACSAPTHQMAMKWLRELHNIQIIIIPIRTKQHKNWTFEIYKEFNPLTIDVFCFSTYEEAVEAALKYSLENLI